VQPVHKAVTAFGATRPGNSESRLNMLVFFGMQPVYLSPRAVIAGVKNPVELASGAGFRGDGKKPPALGWRLLHRRVRPCHI